eukprot:1307171-Karenia_brevis.AAC.1
MACSDSPVTREEYVKANLKDTVPDECISSTPPPTLVTWHSAYRYNLDDGSYERRHTIQDSCSVPNAKLNDLWHCPEPL